MLLSTSSSLDFYLFFPEDLKAHYNESMRTSEGKNGFHDHEIDFTLCSVHKHKKWM